ncbi:MAG: FtsB family cell division protein [Egibacteraceae bacterium]
MSGRQALKWLQQGDRIYLLPTLGLAALLGAMAIGPVKSFTAAADRVDQLYRSRAELQSQVDRLEQRRVELANLEEIELLAREQLGLVRPGEIPYVVVAYPPSGASPQAPSQAEPSHVRLTTPTPAGQPWYRRLDQALHELRG